MYWLRRLFRRGPKHATLTADLLSRIRGSFDQSASDEEHFPPTIDPRIYHVKVILDHLGDLNGRRALDVGCGKGRFARIVQERNPGATVCGLDLSEAMLRFVPRPVHPVSATMTALPFPSASFDAVYATESLEHAVDIETAIAEICRVTRPGGRIAIIDKNSEYWGRFQTPEWERWFRPKELERLLGRHCSSVSSRFISYWEDVAPDGLFVAWLARK